MVSKIALSVLVRNCPCLYDGNDSEYGDQRKMDASWQAIASVLNISVSEVQNQWTKCCQIYYKYRNDAQGLHSADNQTRKLIEQMQFIEPHLLNRSFPYLTDTFQANQSMNSQKKTVTITKLIKLVQEHPVLYDSKNLNYRNKKHREDAWNAIAETLGESVTQCTNKWSYVRKTFRKYIKSNTSIDKSKAQKTHPYAKELKFLIPVLAERVIRDTCKDQRKQIQNVGSVEVVEIAESSDDDDDEDEEESFDEITFNSVNNGEIDSTMNDESRTEKRARDEQSSSHSKKRRKANCDSVNGENEIRANENGIDGSSSNNGVVEEEEAAGATENGRQSDGKCAKIEFPWTNADISNLENDPDMLFFRSLLPEVHLMTSQQKNKFRLAVLTSIDEILNNIK